MVNCHCRDCFLMVSFMWTFYICIFFEFSEPFFHNIQGMTRSIEVDDNGPSAVDLVSDVLPDYHRLLFAIM